MSTLVFARNPITVVKKIQPESVSLVFIRVPRIPADHPKVGPVSKHVIRVINACKRVLSPTGILAVTAYGEQSSILQFVKNNILEFVHPWAKGTDGSQIILYSPSTIVTNDKFLPVNDSTKRDIVTYLKAHEDNGIPAFQFMDNRAYKLRTHSQMLKIIAYTFGQKIILFPFWDHTTLSTSLDMIWNNDHGGQRFTSDIIGVTNNREHFQLCRNSVTLEPYFQFAKV